MKKQKDMLSDKQFQLNRRISTDSSDTDKWLRSVGLDPDRFASTSIPLLKAERQAHMLLKHHGHQLNETQRDTLRLFKKQMNNRTRDGLKASAARPVFDIYNKINKQRGQRQEAT